MENERIYFGQYQKGVLCGKHITWGMIAMFDRRYLEYLLNGSDMKLKKEIKEWITDVLTNNIQFEIVKKK